MNNLQEAREKNKATCASAKKSLVYPDLNLVLKKIENERAGQHLPQWESFNKQNGTE